MLAILNSFNVHDFPIFQPISMIIVSKFMVCRALSDKTYLYLGLLSPLKLHAGHCLCSYKIRVACEGSLFYCSSVGNNR